MHKLILTCCLILLFFSTGAGAKIVFRAIFDGINGIYVMNDDGSNITLITDTPIPIAPRWSPDGKQIVFQKRDPLDSQRGQLAMINADGTHLRQLTELPHAGRDTNPAFSPDGTSILFRRYEIINDDKKNNLICVLNLKRGDIRNIVSGIAVNPLDWSPDGKHIVFSNADTIGGAGGTLQIMDADGGNLRELIPPHPAGKLVISRSNPRWSPDGKQIVYQQVEYTWEPFRNGFAGFVHAYRYFICDRNGKTLKRLEIPKNWEISNIDWIDDGKSLVFSARERELNAPRPPPELRALSTIYKYHIWTGKITHLTPPGKYYSLDWISDHAHAVSPLGKKKTRWGKLKRQSKD